MLATLRRTAAGRPELSAAKRSALDAVPPELGAGLRFAARRELLGLWRPVIPPGTWYGGGGHVRFRGSGTWTGSDGCNGQSGQWRYENRRLLAIPPGAVGEVACSSSPPPEGMPPAPRQPVASWTVTAVAAAFEGDVLVLLDHAGRGLGRLGRSAR